MKVLLKQARDFCVTQGEIVFLLGGMPAVEKLNALHAALQAAIAQPEPEPDAYLVYDKASSSQYACLDEDLGDMEDCEVRPLYLRQAPSKPLTDAQMLKILGDELDSDDTAFIRFARALEAAHGIAQTPTKSAEKTDWSAA